MTGTEWLTKLRYYTKTTTATFTAADALVLANDIKNELAPLIALKNEDLFVMTSTLDLVASSVTAREYPLPDDKLNELITVEGAFDTAQATVFVPILPFPGGMQQLLREINGITEAKITNYFSNQKPKYIKIRNGIYILSGTISVLTAGLKIRYRLNPADLANLTGTTGLHIDPTTSSFGMPLSLHELWVRRASIIWKSMRPKPIPLSPLELTYNQDLSLVLDAIAKNDLGEEIISSISQDDGQDL